MARHERANAMARARRILGDQLGHAGQPRAGLDPRYRHGGAVRFGRKRRDGCLRNRVSSAQLVAPYFWRRGAGGQLSARLHAKRAQSPQRAWQLLSVLFAWLAIVLAAIVVLGELACAWWWTFRGDDPSTAQLVGLLAAMLPYLLFICLAAQAAAALQAMFEFRVPAVAPLLLNLVWLAAAWWVAPRYRARQTCASLRAGCCDPSLRRIAVGRAVGGA